MDDRETLIPFTNDHLAPARELFVASYLRERAHSPLLPDRAIDDAGWISGALAAHLARPGVALLRGGQLCGYMLTGSLGRWKGQRAAFVPEYGHAAIPAGQGRLYQRMYRALAGMWIQDHVHLHVIGHFAHDAALQETLYQLGFGAILAERLRPCEPLAEQPDAAIRVVADARRLVPLQREHSRYYAESPIFITKPAGDAELLAELSAHLERGDTILTVEEQGEPGACLIVGESPIDSEGFLLQQTNTAQVKSAYVRPALRARGLGTALLDHAVRWARQRGYTRLFVEHETANLFGAAFWGKHFSPYLTFAMRYIDNAL